VQLGDDSCELAPHAAEVLGDELVDELELEARAARDPEDVGSTVDVAAEDEVAAERELPRDTSFVHDARGLVAGTLGRVAHAVLRLDRQADPAAAKVVLDETLDRLAASRPALLVRHESQD